MTTNNFTNKYPQVVQEALEDVQRVVGPEYYISDYLKSLSAQELLLLLVGISTSSVNTKILESVAVWYKNIIEPCNLIYAIHLRYWENIESNVYVGAYPEEFSIPSLSLKKLNAGSMNSIVVDVFNCEGKLINSVNSRQIDNNHDQNWDEDNFKLTMVEVKERICRTNRYAPNKPMTTDMLHNISEIITTYKENSK